GLKGHWEVPVGGRLRHYACESSGWKQRLLVATSPRKRGEVRRKKLPPLHCNHHPARHFAGRQKVQRRAPHPGRVSLAMCDRDEEIAAARDGHSDRSPPRAIGHFEIISPD